MKIVHFSDLHLDSAFAWMSATPDAARKRRRALRGTLRKIIELTVEVGADALFCGGDLYEHDRFASDTGAFLRETLGSLGQTRVFIAPGNHDRYDSQSLYRTVDWPPNVHVFSEAALKPVSLTEGLTLWGAAHLVPANTPGFFDEGFHVDRSGIHAALFHGSERFWFPEQESGKQLHSPFDVQQIPSAGLHHAFLGHFHRPRDHDWFTYPGNPEPLTFGEDGQRGAVVATIEPDGSVHRTRVQVAVSQVHDLTVDVTGSESQQDVCDRVYEVADGLQGSARILLIGELSPNVDLRPSDISSLDLSFDSPPVITMDGLYVAYDVDSIAEEQTVRGEFVRSVLNEGLSSEDQRRVLATGLRALDGRDDLEVF